MELGNCKLKEVRIKKGITVTELAKACKLSNRTIYRIEAAEGNPKEETLNKVLNTFNKMTGEDLSFNDIFKVKL